MVRGKALSEPQHKVVTMGRKGKAVGQGDLKSRLSVTPLGYWRGMLSAYTYQHSSSQRLALALCAGH